MLYGTIQDLSSNFKGKTYFIQPLLKTWTVPRTITSTELNGLLYGDETRQTCKRMNKYRSDM